MRFYACAGDPVSVAARLVGKALDRGEALWVCGDLDSLKLLSRRLWLAPGFMAHAEPGASAVVRARSRVVLNEQAPDQAVPLLLNLGAALRLDALLVRRLFDVFGRSEHERRAARDRFRTCQEAGWPTETVQVGIE